jgi:hypothetical protein
MEHANIQRYADAMKEIKLRISVILSYNSGERNSKYKAATVETLGLQFRKVFELIAFSSLAANQELYSTVHSDFAKHWEAAKLIKNLRRINPDFYPKPVVEKKTSQPGVLHQLVDRGPDYLTQEDLIEAHGRCGALMHASNPFAQAIDYTLYERLFPNWLTRIINLLNNHRIHLPGDTGAYHVHMQEEGHDEVRWYRFERVAKSN